MGEAAPVRLENRYPRAMIVGVPFGRPQTWKQKLIRGIESALRVDRVELPRVVDDLLAPFEPPLVLADGKILSQAAPRRDHAYTGQVAVLGELPEVRIVAVGSHRALILGFDSLVSSVLPMFTPCGNQRPPLFLAP